MSEAQVMRKVSIQPVPNVTAPAPPGPGRLTTDAGALVRIVDNSLFRFAAYIEFLPDPKAPRGNHYHARKTELLYVISGRLEAIYVDIDTKEYLKRTLAPDDLVVVSPGCAHVYYAAEHSQAIELASEPYDPADTIPISVEKLLASCHSTGGSPAS